MQNVTNSYFGIYSGGFFFYFFKFLFIYLFIFGCVGSSFLCEGFLRLRRAGATPHRGARASHHRGLSCCGAQAPDAQAQLSWLTGQVAPRHAGSPQTRDRTHVPCTSRQTLNHCAAREALWWFLTELNILLPCAAAIIILGIYSNELKMYVPKKVHMDVYTSFIHNCFIHKLPKLGNNQDVLQ